MKHVSTNRIVYAALFAALTCGMTALLRVPSPVGGYIHLGDGPVLLGAFLLGPWWGAAAAGLGSMLADLLAGYPMYAAGTLAIKALAALAAGLLFKRLKRSGKGTVFAAIPAGAVAAVIVTVAYFAWTAACLGYGLAAAAEIPGNLCQGAAGIAVAAAVAPRLLDDPRVQEMLERR